MRLFFKSIKLHGVIFWSLILPFKVMFQFLISLRVFLLKELFFQLSDVAIDLFQQNPD
jgi:hypothetical protein